MPFGDRTAHRCVPKKVGAEGGMKCVLHRHFHFFTVSKVWDDVDSRGL